MLLAIKYSIVNSNSAFEAFYEITLRIFTACSVRTDKQRRGRNIQFPRQIDGELRSKYVRHPGHTLYYCQVGFRTKT